MIEKTYIDICKRQDLDMDIIPYYCGYEECTPGYQFGPLVRDQYILHYIVSGSCTFEEDNRIYHIDQQQGFVIFPHTPIYFKADSKEKLCHFWIGFGGKKAASYLEHLNFSIEHPVYTYDDARLYEAMNSMHAINPSANDSQFELLSNLYRIFSLLSLSSKHSDSQTFKSDKDAYVRKAIELITINYFARTSIDDIAKKINIDKKYLASVLKAHYGITPHKLLTNFRVLKAGELLCSPKLSISEIARSVGYEDPLHFSRVFKKIKGLSPEKYRLYILKGKEV